MAIFRRVIPFYCVVLCDPWLKTTLGDNEYVPPLVIINTNEERELPAWLLIDINKGNFPYRFAISPGEEQLQINDENFTVEVKLPNDKPLGGI